MGEYIKINNEQVKLGTCEDLYYTRYSQLKNIVSMAGFCGGNAQPEEYLNPKNGFRYRFPFPEEDNKQIGDYEDYDKGIIFTVDSDFETEHKNICVSTSVNGSYNINHNIKCPNSKNWEQSCSAKHASPYLLKQQKQVDGHLWIVCECGYCHNKFRLDKEGAWQVIKFFVKNLNYRKSSPNYSESNNKYYIKVIKRIARGYLHTI